MNRPIRILSIGCLVLFLGLLINVNYLQFVSADDLNSRDNNKRVINDQFSRDRGPILVEGEPVAESVPVDDEYDYQRTYHQPFLYSHLTGYFSYIYGNSQIESSQNDILSGEDDRLFVNRVVDLVGNQQPEGGQVALTIDRKAQKAAREGLAGLDEKYGSGFKGSVVALDPQSGEILAMVNRPSYNANRLATHDLEKSQQAYKQLVNANDNPMMNRAAEATVPPGSTFKLVTAAAALDELNLKPSSNVYGGQIYEVNGFELFNETRESCAGGNTATFRTALENSCNTSFGSLAVKVGEKAMEAQAKKFGFGQDYLDALSMNESVFSSEASADMSENEDLLAKSGIGQQDVRATPLQMAMVTAGVANDGEVMKPYLVDEVRSPDFDVLDETEPQPIDNQPAMSSENAKTLQDMLVSTVTDGTASSAQIDGIAVGGKTGTAQRGTDQAPYSWFVSFAPADDPQIAVAVMLEPPTDYTGDVSGGGMAGPIAKSVMEAVLK